MIRYLFRFFKRVAVLIPGLVIFYIAFNDLFPTLDKHLPSDALAILATYIVAAYVLVPAFIRFVRIFFKGKHIPLYCLTPDGFASDPINVGIVGTKEQLIDAMTRAGWFEADRRTPKTVFRLVYSIILGKTYRNAPFSSLYLFGRSQDIGFELPLDSNPRHRHHVRFWAADYNVGGNKKHEHVSFWHLVHRSNLRTGRMLWVGAASLDNGIGVIRHNAQLTHMVHHDTNAERELISKQLKRTGIVKKQRMVNIGRPYYLKNRVIMGYLQADGKMAVSEL